MMRLINFMREDELEPVVELTCKCCGFRDYIPIKAFLDDPELGIVNLKCDDCYEHIGTVKKVENDIEIIIYKKNLFSGGYYPLWEGIKK